MDIYIGDKGEKKARAKGGIIMAVNKKMDCAETKACSERVAKMKIRINERTLSTFTIYSQNTKEIFNQIEPELQEAREEGRLLIGEDFNAGIGEKGGPIRDVKNAEKGCKKIERQGSQQGRAYFVE